MTTRSQVHNVLSTWVQRLRVGDCGSGLLQRGGGAPPELLWLPTSDSRYVPKEEKMPKKGKGKGKGKKKGKGDKKAAPPPAAALEDDTVNESSKQFYTTQIKVDYVAVDYVAVLYNVK